MNKTKKKISKKEAISSKDSDKLLKYCVENNTFSFNMNKALEECAEFSEVLLKLQTKTKDNLKGLSEEDAIKEFGDVIYRGMIALATLFPNNSIPDIRNKVGKHILYKINKLKSYLKEGKYKGGL